MQCTWSVDAECLSVGGRTISLVAIETVGGIIAMGYLYHPRIPMCLGQNGSCRDGWLKGISTHNTAMWHSMRSEAITVNQQEVVFISVRLQTGQQRIDGEVHGVIGRLKDVHVINTLLIDVGHCPRESC